MTTGAKISVEARDPKADQEQKKVALSYLHEAWAEALLDGVEVDCMAQACLFAALAEMVSTYGEDAAARYAEGLAARIHNGEFSIDLSRQ
jgi:hypothetical protein